ncbi:serine/threonine protein kinase [Candidatus Magnetoovum chiemensis]|nr:serine/threonine protein kinase [Candidatus Magnetoovum chiemensis]
MIIVKEEQVETINVLDELGIEMVYVRGGEFEMGDVFGDGYDYEKPVHTVELDDYWIGKYPVTQMQWESVMGYNPSYFKGCGSLPVESVSWYEAKEFVSILSGMTGIEFGLPSEAQWEYACRGRGAKVRFGTGSNTIGSDTANFNASKDYKTPYSEVGVSRGKTTPVGFFKDAHPNGLGIYDMSGNVWEWCEDVWSGDAYRQHARRNPKVLLSLIFLIFNSLDL